MMECLQQNGVFTPAFLGLLLISLLLWVWFIQDFKHWPHLTKEERKKRRDRYLRLAVLSVLVFMAPILAFFFPLYAINTVWSCL